VSLSALSVETVPAHQPRNVHPAQVEDTTSPWLLALFLVAITLLSYWPTFSNGFLNYDDNGYILQNIHVQPGLTAANASWAFRESLTTALTSVAFLVMLSRIQLRMFVESATWFVPFASAAKYWMLYPLAFG